MSTFPPARKIQLPETGDSDGAIELAVHEAGEGPAVVFVHGFPDLARGWRNQLVAVADAGFHAIAPDMRGYGGSSCPQAVEAYAIDKLAGDLVGLLDALEIEKATFVGHDWGGFVVWAMAVLHPSRVSGIAAACTPYMPFPSVAKHLEVVEGDVERQYVAWFQEDGIAEAHMDQHVATIVNNTMRTSAPLEAAFEAAFADGKLNMNPFWPLGSAIGNLGDPLMSAAETELYIKAFSQTGFRGGINWYRNIDQNASAHPGIGVVPLDLPCLMVTAELDPGLRPEFADDMPERCSNLEIHLIEGASHWVQQEKAAEFNGLLVPWLMKHFSNQSTNKA